MQQGSRLPSRIKAGRALSRLIAGLVAAACLALGPSLASARGGDRVVVASKIDTEGALLGNMIVLLLERAGVPVENRLGFGPTRTVRAALLSGAVDIYPEYTGNGALFHGMEGDPAWRSPPSAFDTVRRLDRERHGLVWLDRAPANNTWAIAVRGDLARAERLSTMQDFAALVQRGGAIRLAGSAEFVESPAALPSFERTYGFRMERTEVVVTPGGDTAGPLRAAAGRVDGVNAAMAYGTDGAIAALDLAVMEDTRGAQVVYEPAPVARAAVLERFPAIGPLLSRAFGSLTLTRLQSLNAEITVGGRAPRDVARTFLERERLLR